MASKRTFSHNGSPNSYALHDTGAALAHFMLQAHALGLYTHGMAGFDRARAREILGIPDDYDLGAAVALGYLDTPDKLKDQQQRQAEVAKRVRRPLHELAFGAHWGEPLAL
jgi:nitroreductase